MEHKEYNGWTNYETWNVNLWLDNEEGTQYLQREWIKRAKQTPKTEVLTRAETTRFILADLVKVFIEDANPLLNTASVYSDLMNAALSEVNWQEIADSILEDS